MPDFKYTAIDIDGKKKKGIINLPDIELIKPTLLEKNLFLVEVQPYVKKVNRKKLSDSELAEFCRELSSLLSSGIPLVKSINIILSSDIPINLKNTFSEINSSIRKGSSLSEAMEFQDFPELMINMIKVGEESGKLDKSVEKLAVMYEKEHRLKTTVRNAMAYPVALLFLSVVVMIVIFTVILPKFFKLFDDIALPLSTRIVMAIGNVFKNHYMAIIIIFITLIIMSVFLLKHPATRIKFDKFILKVPKISNLLKIIYTSRFANTLSSLYSSGIPIASAIMTAGNAIGNLYISEQITESAKKVRSGFSLAESLSKVDGFERKLSSSLAVGEESGKIDILLDSLSESYEYESEVAVKKIVSFIEPVMICIMGLFVAFIVISVMQPIYTLYSDI